VKVVSSKTGLVLQAGEDSPEDRALLDEFVKLGAPTKEIVLGAVTHKSDKHEGPVEVRIDWQAKA
jgi:hypothetical protein